MIKLFKFLLIALCWNISLFAEHLFYPPTQKYLEDYSIDEIKYNLRLDNTTLIYKDLFDKAVSKECEGIIGYHGSSLEYRIFQDVIKMVLQEIVGVEIQDDFHFFDIPGFREQRLHDLTDVPLFFLPEKNASRWIERQLFPLNLALYSNHNRIGFSSVVNFTRNVSEIETAQLILDLKEFFDRLGMDRRVVEEAFHLGKSVLNGDRGILLQIFDLSDNSYSFADSVCYPSNPNGYPFANRAISDYYDCEKASDFPRELRILLTDPYTLNPNAPLSIKRYDKIQPSIVKSYERSLRDLIQNAGFEKTKVEQYRQVLFDSWLHAK